MTTTITQTAGFVGNVATEPEVRFSKAGRAWTSFRLAVKPYVAGATEQPEPEYFEVICLGSLAENVAATCHRGSRVVVAGKLEEDTWTGHDGVDRTTQKIIAEGIGPAGTVVAFCMWEPVLPEERANVPLELRALGFHGPSVGGRHQNGDSL